MILAKRLLVLTLVSNLLFGIQLFPKMKDPCSDPIIATAKEKGIKGLSMIETVRYLRVEKACKNLGGHDETFYLIESKEYQRDYEQSRYMVSWTSTFSYCVGVAIFYYFVLGSLADN